MSTSWRLPITALSLCLVGSLNAQTARPLAVDQSRYRVRAGERIEIQGSAESLEFMRTAKSRVARASGQVIRAFALAPNIEGDKILLGVPLTTVPGEYAVEVSFMSDAGAERSARIQLTVEPLTTTASSVPPVVLLDGFQLSITSSCPMSSDSSGNFDNLQTFLEGPPNNAQVYFFENCTECPNCTIEQLGADLGVFLNLLPNPQVDVVAHSMGGLIVRSYLSGKQAVSGAFSPPLVQKIRKAVFIATPHFGAIAADFMSADIFLAFGTQTNELKPASQFIWDLATWNQFGDDLRGIDAISIVGNAGPSNEGDGVVDSTSASLDFSLPGRTRVVGYCHVPPTTADDLAGPYLECYQPGIAYVDTTAHPTYIAVSSFLLNETAWQTVGIPPAQDQYLSVYGAIVVADISSSNQYAYPTGVSWGAVTLSQGGASELYYNDFVNGTDTFNFGSSTCGPYTATAGKYSTVRCKFSPSIGSVGPLLPGTARVVQAGGTITIAGAGFGAQQCSTCRVMAENPNATNLTVLSWSNSTITATLPASFGIGIVTIVVTAANGSDAINIMAGTVAVPVIALSASTLRFAFTVGGSTPSAQSVSVSNTGGGSLSYTTSSSASWLIASPSGTTISISVNPASLAPSTYQGTITVAAAGASNTPQVISVSLVVTAAAPTVVISTVRHSATGLSGPIAPGELITIYGTGLGPAVGQSFSLDPSTGMVDTKLAGTQVFFGTVAGPITYTSATQVNVIAPYEISDLSQVAIQVQYQGNTSTSQSIQVVPASPGAYTLSSGGSGPVVAANQDYSINGPSNPAAKGSYVTIYFTGGGQTNPPGVTGSVTGSVLKWLTQPISVTVGNQPAVVEFDGSAPTFVDGVDQLNIQLSQNTPSGAQSVVITIGGISSPASVTLAVQ